mgnify:CR=1 FL=1
MVVVVLLAVTSAVSYLAGMRRGAAKASGEGEPGKGEEPGAERRGPPRAASEAQAATTTPAPATAATPGSTPAGASDERADETEGGTEAATAEVASIALTSEFLVYGTTSGGVCYFHLPERVHVCEYKHGQGAVTTLKVNALGTRVVFVDERATPIFLNPVIDQTCHIPDFQGPAQAILWDATDPECFVISNGAEYQVYAYAPSTINGPVVELVGTHPQTAGSTPV